MAKKILIAALLAISLVSCNGILSTRESASVAFNLDMRELVPQTASPNSNGRFAIDGSLTVTASLISSDTTIATTSKSATMDSIVPIEFKVEQGKAVSAKITITDSAGAVIYEGSSDTQTLKPGKNNIIITIQSRTFLFEEVGTSSRSWKTLYTTDKNASPSIDIGTGSIGDIDFDSYGNAYAGVEGGIFYQFGPESRIITPSVDTGKYFAIDRATNNFYYTDPDTHLYRFALSAHSEPTATLITDSYNIKLFTVHDNVVYTANIDRGAKINQTGTTTITKHPIRGTLIQLAAIATFTFPSNYDPVQDALFPSIIHGYYINDITWQDGYLWVLMSSLPVGYPDNVKKDTTMKGALLQINPSNMTLVATHGLTSGTRPTPSNNQSYFYGPTRFIALVPKKLIIADEGVWLENYLSDGRAHQRNRIMTFDIATGRLSAMDTTVEFANTLGATTCGGYDPFD